MHEHSRGALSGGFTDLGAVLADIADVIEAAVEAGIEQDIITTLTTAPEITELAELTRRMITHCKSLAVGLGEIPLAQRSTRAAGALRDWTDVASAEPQADVSHDETGDLSYVRMLALIARSMLKALREQRTSRSFVGRIDLPPAC
ncbi:hypothetical protein [Streptomyces subrutilus]|uniref:Uncharacterized protein n=1 Tax=Streptomyces subrutilus TaxID=36818 RepID=A0A1E5PKC2_9ACTN|nr:hypothetical protein [Streptomyces subrutilus]OEJ30018.1 hypothetical protein BGK67_00190 [Streptomyces subrutilus]